MILNKALFVTFFLILASLVILGHIPTSSPSSTLYPLPPFSNLVVILTGLTLYSSSQSTFASRFSWIACITLWSVFPFPFSLIQPLLNPWDKSILVPWLLQWDNCMTWAYIGQHHSTNYKWSPLWGVYFQVAKKVIKTQSSRSLRSSLLTFVNLTSSQTPSSFVPVTPERSWHICHQSPVLDSPEPCPPISGLPSSPFIPGGFTHSSSLRILFHSYLNPLV